MSTMEFRMSPAVTRPRIISWDQPSPIPGILITGKSLTWEKMSTWRTRLATYPLTPPGRRRIWMKSSSGIEIAYTRLQQRLFLGRGCPVMDLQVGTSWNEKVAQP
jgi:hypothetical protein